MGEPIEDVLADDDLVVRLRGMNDDLDNEAADEIEKLRADLYEAGVAMGLLQKQHDLERFVETSDEVLDASGNAHWGWYRKSNDGH